MDRFSTEYGKKILECHLNYARLRGWTYPGNVRELQNDGTGSGISVGNVLRKEDLPDEIWETGSALLEVES